MQIVIGGDSIDKMKVRSLHQGIHVQNMITDQTSLYDAVIIAAEAVTIPTTTHIMDIGNFSEFEKRIV